MDHKMRSNNLKIITDDQGIILKTDGDSTFFAGMEVIAGKHVTDYFDVMEALIPPSEPQIHLPNIEIRENLHVNIDIHIQGRKLLIEMIDNSQSVASYRDELQRNNETRYLKQDEERVEFPFEEILSESLFNLSACIFEYTGKGRAVAAGKLPHWLKSIHPEIKSSIPIGLTETFPFLETIIPEFEQMIAEKRNGKILSEIWAEEEADGNEKLLQCMAVVNKNIPWLVIYAHETLLIRDREILQKAREQRLYTDELQKARKELQKLLNFKDQFISIITHDLRSPVSSVVSATDMMLRDEDFRSAIKDLYLEFLETINKDMKLLLDYNEKLYYWSNLQLGKFNVESKQISLSALIRDTRNRFFDKAEKKNIELKTVAEGDILISADESLFSQALTNLVNNAIKFTPSGGEIILQAEQHGEQVILGVKDTGLGIEEDLQKNIFSGYVKNHSDGTGGEKGSGLGLGIVKRIVDAHGFEIDLESRPGKGTEFIIRIPVKN